MYHYWTHHTNELNQLQPGFFIEIPEELARERGIANGSRARVTSARGSIEGLAMVTRRLRQLTIDGQRVWHIGFPLHWGYEGDPKHVGPLANFLTPSAMDPNTWTPEFKTFLVRLEKVAEGVS
jgi:formate dehydrogenase major subunit